RMSGRVRHGRTRRLLHHVAELASQDEGHIAPTADLRLLVISGALAVGEQATDRHLDEHDVAARRRVIHARRHAYFVLFGGALGVHLWTTEELAHLVGVDLSIGDDLRVTGGDLSRHLASDGTDLSLQLANASLTRVLAD